MTTRLQHLLCSSREAVHVRTLDALESGAPLARAARADAGVRVVEGLGDAGEVLDERARRAYRERLAEVRAELEEAERNHDPGRADRLQAELAALEMELGAAVGLGRRPRRIRSDLERRRVAATKRIRATIAKIAAVCPALGEHHPSVTARLVAAARRNLGRRGSDRTSGPASVTRRVLLDAQFMSMLAQLVVLRAAEGHLLERDALRRDEMDRVGSIAGEENVDKRCRSPMLRK